MIEIIKKITPSRIKKYYYRYKLWRTEKYYRGDNVECPLCKSTYGLFRPYGIVERLNALCPNCHSLERHRLLWLYLNEKANIFSNTTRLKTLHFAPESFYYNIFDKMNNITYVPCDLFPEKYRYNGKTSVAKMDITNIDCDDSSFDFIICNHVLEHIPDDLLAMKELYRVMKKGGFGIFQVPINYSMDHTFEDFTVITPEERLKIFGQEDHVRIYGKDYIERLRSVGFEVFVDNYVQTFSKEDIFKYGLASDELIYKCVKN